MLTRRPRGKLMKQEEEPPIEGEIIDEGEPRSNSGELQRIEGSFEKLTSAFSGLFRSPDYEAKQARKWANAVHAQAELKAAQIDLSIAVTRFEDVDDIIQKERLERRVGIAEAEDKLADFNRKAKLRQQADELAAIEMAVKLAEARRSLREAENPAPPLDEETRRREAVAKSFRERMGRRFTEHEVRAHAAQLIAEIKARAGGEITPAIQREIDNVTDIMDHLLGSL
jgi:hypothetical protein